VPNNKSRIWHTAKIVLAACLAGLPVWSTPVEPDPFPPALNVANVAFVDGIDYLASGDTGSPPGIFIHSGPAPKTEQKVLGFQIPEPSQLPVLAGFISLAAALLRRRTAART